MIVSASCRTDIPAFYGDWLMRRLAVGACRLVSPWNQKTMEVSLRAADVDGFVFWTQNAMPFRRQLPKIGLHALFYVQYMVTGYPGALEQSDIADDQAVSNMKAVATEFGARAVVWRYDRSSSLTTRRPRGISRTLPNSPPSSRVRSMR